MDIGFDPATLLADMAAAAHAAGACAMRFFRPGERTRATVSYKSGNSPVTEADLAADRLLEDRLRKALPHAALISEERADEPTRLAARAVFIVDPIDGTRAFMRGDPRWAVSAALAVDGRPVLGVLRLPALDLTFTAAYGRGAALNGAPIVASARTDLRGAYIAGPAPLLAALRAGGLVFEEAPRIPSLAFRLAEVARGGFDAAFASRHAYDWDIAAADLLLHESGAALCGVDGAAPVYNRADLRHPVLAAAPRGLMSPVIERLGALDSPT